MKLELGKRYITSNGNLSIAAEGTIGNQGLSFVADSYTADDLRQAAATLISMAEGMEL